ncbi:MAG TPA: hypothetical protein VMT30_00825 [Candidatus Saccharimonadia bacterium]|nr:hypothetical protein [Candidatus Saccharimonadia bacterium]
MFTLSGLLIGLSMVALGILGIKFTFWIHNVTGPLDFLERYTGSGSTYGIYKILSVLLVMIGIIWATGFGHNVMDFIFSPFVNLFRPGGSSQ